MIIIAHLLSWWKCNGNANDSIGGLHGTATAALVAGRYGEANGAYDMETGLIQCASSSILDRDNHTICFWFKFTGFVAGWRNIFDWGVDGRSPCVWRYTDCRRLHWQYNPDNLGFSYLGITGQGGTEFSDNVWYWVAVAKKGALATAFVNGINVGTVTVPNPKAAGAYALSFGDAVTKIHMTDIRIYDDQISLKEARAIYHNNIAHWKLDNDGLDCSGYQYDGVVDGGAFSTDSKIGSHSWQKTADTDEITTTCYPDSQNTTYSFWFKTTGTGGTLSEAVLGHRSGSNGFMFYRNDANTDTQFHALKYFTGGAGSILCTNTFTLDTWNHVVCAYDENGNYKIFKNGVKTHGALLAGFTSWDDSGVPFYIGYGGDGWVQFRGYVDDVRIFMTYLSDEDCIALYEERMSLDNEGNLHAQEFIINGIGEDITNIFKYEKWILGTYTTSQTFNGGLPNSDMHINARSNYTNYIAIYDNPVGNSDIMLHTEITTTHLSKYAHVGLYYDCNIDNTKTYRFSQWVYFHYVASNPYIRHYIGIQGNTVCTLNTTTLVGNPYMSYPYINDANFLDKWVLQVYYIFPYNSIGNSSIANRIYQLDGSNISYGTEYNWANVSSSHIRQLVMYQTTDAQGDYSAGNYIKTYRPRFEIIDGTESSIEDLLIAGTHLPLLNKAGNFQDKHSLSNEGIYYMRGGDEIDLGIGDPEIRLTEGILYVNGKFIEV